LFTDVSAEKNFQTLVKQSFEKSLPGPQKSIVFKDI